MTPISHAFAPALPFMSPAAVVNEGTALGIPALDKGIGLIANAVAQMAPPQLWDGARLVGSTPFLDRPYPYLGQYDFWNSAIRTAILHGNWIAMIDRDEFGVAQAVVPVHPMYVQMMREGLNLGYMIYGQAVRPENVLHVRGDMMSGSPVGMGLLEKHRRGLGLALDIAQYSATAYRGAGVPSVYLKVNGKASEDALDELLEAWTEKYSSAGRTPVALPEGLEVIPLNGFSPENMEALAARALSIAECAFMLGLDPADLGTTASQGGGGALTYANVSDRKATRYFDAVAPWIARFQDAFSDLIPGDTTCRFQTDKLLGLDEAARTDVDIKLIQSGILTVDEVRAQRGLAPLPESPAPVATPEQELPE